MGDVALEILGIPIEAFSMAGCVIIFILGYDLYSSDENTKKSTLSGDYAAIVPLAMPIIAGPAMIAIIINQLHRVGISTSHKLTMSLSIITVNLLLFLSFYFAHYIMRVIKGKPLRIIKKFTGIIWIAIAFEIFYTAIVGLIAKTYG
jgi:multiple antibiotic resistance protein